MNDVEFEQFYNSIKNKTYSIVKERTATDLIEAVNKLKKRGWNTTGGIQVNHEWYHQVIERQDTTKKELLFD